MQDVPEIPALQLSIVRRLPSGLPGDGKYVINSSSFRYSIGFYNTVQPADDFPLPALFSVDILKVGFQTFNH